MNNKLLILVSILLISSVSFIAYGQYIEYKDNLITEAFINGTSYGANTVLSTLTQEAIQCKQIPITYGNYSYNLFAVECINNLNNSGGNK